MSICGLIMQQLTRNKFVSPTTAATMDFAKLGMLVAMVFFAGASIMHKMLFAFACSLLGTFLFMGIMKQVKFQNSLFIPLIGMMLGNVVNSITSFIAYQFDLVQNISSWAQGRLYKYYEGELRTSLLKYSTCVCCLFICKQVYDCWNGRRLLH